MEDKDSLICSFRIDQQRFAIFLDSAEYVLRALSIIPVPEAPPFLHGLMNFYGEIIAVINLRKRFNLSEKPIGLSDHFLVAHTEKRKLALVVDEVEGVSDISGMEKVCAGGIHAGIKISRISKDEKGIVLIYDLEDLLSFQEELQLQKLFDSLSEKTGKE